MRGTVGDIAAVPGGTDFSLAFLQEVTAVITAVGTPPSEAFLTATKALLVQQGSPMTSSMYRDLQQGAPVEADQILGDLVARGKRAGVATPLIAAAFAHLTIYQNRL
jgi:2-dehydropantoate 2-reductase